MQKKNIRFLGWQPSDKIAEYYSNAKAFIFPGEEDFGITPVEAQASGTPVIGFGRGGLLETVIDGKTGILFKKQEVKDLVDAVEYFNSGSIRLEPESIRENALKFKKEVFELQFEKFVEEKYLEYSETYLK